MLPEIDERLRHAWSAAGFDPELLREDGRLPQIRFGNWVGGDRDGHPGVTADVTAETLERLRANALVVIHRQLAELAEKLTLSGWMQPAPATAGSGAGEAGGRRWATRRPHDPLRQSWRAVAAICARPPHRPPAGGDRPLSQTSQLREDRRSIYYRFASELAADLETLYDSLVNIGARRLAESDVRPVLRALEVFGFHLAQIDIRQNSVFHAKALSQLMGAAGIDGSQWEEWSEAERQRFLEKRSCALARARSSMRRPPRVRRAAIASARVLSESGEPHRRTAAARMAWAP